ncbi:CsgG/HfaB family protein [Litorimonas haliclonae]|uniref:CsgG/HfaB family protein n=1 Tax=Litorimonas haliclonae TaxID=2081977 RepID=UPI0039EE53EB
MKIVKRHITKRYLTATAIATCLVFGGCTTVPASQSWLSKEAGLSKVTKTQAALQELGDPSSKVTVAVYNFEDKTGQFKPTDAGQTLSRAVTQGGDELLIKALHDAGTRSWFTVIERSNLNNLLKERQIITEMRARYLGETQINSNALPPLLFAGIILEGGIVGYDTNTVTGGVAARYLGVGGQTDYRQNVVSVHLRAVSVKTGEVLASVTTEKTIASVGIAANAFRFVSFDNLLEADAGITSNEPGLLALRQAVEKSVYALIMEGVETGLWDFKDRAAGTKLLHQYQYERDGSYKAAKLASSKMNKSSKQKQTAQSHLIPQMTPRTAAKTEKAPKAQLTAQSGSQVKTLKPEPVAANSNSPQPINSRPDQPTLKALKQDTPT